MLLMHLVASSSVIGSFLAFFAVALGEEAGDRLVDIIRNSDEEKWKYFCLISMHFVWSNFMHN